MWFPKEALSQNLKGSGHPTRVPITMKGAIMNGAVERRELFAATVVGLGGIAVAGALGSSLHSAANAEEASTGSVSLPEGLSQSDFDNSVVEVEPIAEFAVEYDYDIVVVGAGTSGMPAALTALEEGATVALLQKETTAVSQGAMDSGIVLSESDDTGILGFLQEFRKNSSYRVNMSLAKTFAYHSGETAMWIAKMGQTVGCPADTMTARTSMYLDDRPCFIVSNIFGIKPRSNHELCIALAEWGAQNGIDVYYETPGVQLVFDGERVTGVIGRQADGTYAKFNAATAVILATGDYQNNDSLMKKWSPDIYRFSRKQFGKTGDGILMSALVGAGICPVGHSRQMHDNDSCRMNEEPFLAVDVKGERFMNEDIPMHYWVETLVDHNQEGDPGVFCQIFDDNYPETVSGWGGSPVDKEAILNWVPGAVEEPYNVMPTLIDTHYADTLEELAEMLGIPGEALVASVERYNELCEKGVDEDFGKDAKYMQPIVQPPFWGIRRWVRITATCNGVMVDENYQVVTSGHQPIPGLYAVGFGAGNLDGGIEWNKYLSGMSCGSCMTSGRVAALHAIKGVAEPSNPVTWEDVKDMYTVS